MTKQLCPHDRYTRSMMMHPKVSKEFFREYLPAHIQEMIDFSSIKLTSESFIDEELKLQVADLLFSATFNEKPGFLYILFEHASQSTPLLPFRMHKYTVSAMDKHLITNETDELPLIYPIILYTGKRPCTHSMDLFDLFSPEKKELAKEIFTKPYHLIDLARTPDEELEKFFWFGTMARTLKHIHDSDILPFFEKAFDILKELENLGENRYIDSTVFYMAEVGNAPRKEELMNRMKKLKSINEEKLMTLVDHFKADLLKKGIAKGIEQGIEQSRKERDIEVAKSKQEERIKIAKILLLEGVDIEIISKTTELSKQEIRKFYS
jgi:predicted transposase/invertase (TIGR01784 family)